MFEIVPTILTSDLSEFLKKTKLLSGITDRVQVDIIDGKFIDNQTVSLESLKTCEINLKIDLHLMVKEPEDWVRRALELLPDRLIGQVEMMYDPMRFIQETVDGGMGVGLAVDLETPLTVVSDDIYHMVDMVLLLAAPAGKSGQEFDPKVLEKIEEIRKVVGNLVDVGVDCGLDDKTIPQAQKSGANIFYVNSYLWSAPDPAQRYQELTQLVSK